MCQAKSGLSNFRRDEGGAIAIMFGFALIAIFILVGLAIDGGRAYHARGKTAAALDAASLAAARSLFETSMTDAEIENLARQFFASNMQGSNLPQSQIDTLGVNIDRSTNTVSLTITPSIDTFFGGVVSIDQLSFTEASQSTYNLRDVELGMALDVTGSMGGQKLVDLKVASKDLVDIMIPDAGAANQVRIGLAPYSATVNAGSYASLVTDYGSVDDCVFERNGFAAYTDDAPVSASTWMGFEANPSAASNSKYGCPNAVVLPLSDQKNDLKSTIDSYAAGGWTAGHIGAAWAWYLVSPNWSAIWPAASAPVAYSNEKVIKAVILMTDGNFNTSYKNGAPNSTSSSQAIDVCDEMKDKGVLVYSVAFEAPAAAQATLNSCASTDATSGQKLYYNAQNGTELKNAFRDIAIKLTNLRLAK